MTTFLDDFNRANSTGLGAAWTGYTNTFNVATNAAKAQASATCVAAYGTQATTDDVFAQATVTVFSAGSCGVIARAASIGTADTDTPAYYVFRFATTSTLGLYRKTANSTTLTLIGSTVSHTFAAGDVLRLECVGSTITCYLNGSQVIQQTDTNIATGKYVGIRATDATTRFDDFSGGDVATVPAQVTGLTLGTATSTTQPLSWTAPSNGGAAITDYIIQWSPAGAGTWTTFADGTSTATSATVTGLTPSTSYDYRVAAVNSVGTGPNSATATGSTAAAASSSTPLGFNLRTPALPALSPGLAASNL